MHKTKQVRNAAAWVGRPPKPRKLRVRRPAADIMDFCGILSDEDAKEMKRVIEEEFEQVDED